MMLGDLEVVGGTPPAKLAKALAVVATELHQTFAVQPFMAHPDKSKESCVLSSLAVRDFLWKVGFKRAEVAPVYIVVRALREDGTEIHSVGCGDHNVFPIQTRHHGHVTDTATHWSGHMVVLVNGWLIDPTVYQAKRQQWPELAGMMAAPLFDDPFAHGGDLPLLSGFQAKQPHDGSTLLLSWWHQPHNTRWRGGGDCEKDRRAPVVKAMAKQFGEWRG